MALAPEPTRTVALLHGVPRTSPVSPSVGRHEPPLRYMHQPQWLIGVPPELKVGALEHE